MRIIKLSSTDKDFKKSQNVDEFFGETLWKKDIRGQFLIPNGRIREDGLKEGETVIFTYEGECRYQARAKSHRKRNAGQDHKRYPYYFLIDRESVKPIQGKLKEIEKKLEENGLHFNLVETQCWPRLRDDNPDDRRGAQIIETFVAPVGGTREIPPISQFDLRTFASELNIAARSHPIGALQAIRAELHGKRHLGQEIFRPQTIADNWAFHYGGRPELQFNIGSDGANNDMFRSGVAFSFQTSQALPEIDVLIDKARLFNDFLQLNPDLYADMSMWHWSEDGRSIETSPRAITPELATKGVFLCLGKLRPFHQVTLEAVLDDMDRLLPLYKYIESKGRILVSNVGETKFIFRSGRRSKLTETKANYAQKELDVRLRHNLLLDALERQLVAKYGSKNVCREVKIGLGCSVDLVVRQPEGYWFYEIKTFLSPRACIREAIGQLLEYAFWPGAQEACRLIIVGETAPDQEVLDYCRRLKQCFSLPTEYQQLLVEKV